MDLALLLKSTSPISYLSISYHERLELKKGCDSTALMIFKFSLFIGIV